MSTASPFTEAQRKVLGAFCNAVFTGFKGAKADELLQCVPPDAPDWQRAQVRKLVEADFTDLPGSLDFLGDQFVSSLSKENVEQLGLTLSILSTRAGTLLLTGYGRPFCDLTVEEREKAIMGWKSSKLVLLRRAYRGFVSITLFVAYTYIDECVLAIGYPAGGDPRRSVDPARLQAPYSYSFQNVHSDFQTIHTEVLVIGSGAGGGVVSSELAKKHRVLVVEKGKHVKSTDLTGTPKDGLRSLYENKGIMATENGCINILAGSNFGGGTTINWSASLKPQHYIREEWGKDYNLPYFLTKDFLKSLDFVCDRMKVSPDHVCQNKANARLIDGAISLGYSVGTIPQNTGGHEHSCGFCSFGCLYGEKQGGVVTWLRDAAEAGASFMKETEVIQLLFASSADYAQPTSSTLHKFTPTAVRRRCIGALVQTADGKKAIILASKSVVVSGGSINSPVVLLKSGLKNPNIGRNLRLHPVSYVTAYFDEPIRAWEGSIMTAVSNVVENLDGSHHGAKIEVNMCFPGGTAAAYQPWLNAEQHKRDMLQFNHSFTLIVLARDRGSGRVWVGSDGKFRVDYDLSAYDGASILAGLKAGAEIMLASGARRIYTPQTGIEPYEAVDGHTYLTDPAWQSWITKVDKAGVHASWCALGSAHQMGSNAMGSKPTNSVVDPRGRVWGTEGLYVADASVFPTASAVNPMITNMALSHSIARFIDEDLAATAVADVSPAAQAHL